MDSSKVGGVTTALTRKIGPLPAWGWSLAVAGGVIGMRVVQGKGAFPKSRTASNTKAADPIADGGGDPVTPGPNVASPTVTPNPNPSTPLPPGYNPYPVPVLSNTRDNAYTTTQVNQAITQDRLYRATNPDVASVADRNYAAWVAAGSPNSGYRWQTFETGTARTEAPSEGIGGRIGPRSFSQRVIGRPTYTSLMEQRVSQPTPGLPAIGFMPVRGVKIRPPEMTTPGHMVAIPNRRPVR